MPLEKLEPNSPKSASKAMISDFPVCGPNRLVEDSRTYVLEGAKHFETINYIYVTRDDKKLLGTVSLRELFQAEKSQKISDIMKSDPVCLHPHSDQERAVILALHNNIKAIPVVDQNHILLGIIPSDKILQILHSEHVEDLLRVAGVQSSLLEVSNLGKESVLGLFGRRLPWLLVGLGAGLAATWIIRSFQFVIEAEIFLVAFIPAIVYLSDAVGNQTQILFIRNMTFHELFKFRSYIFRELKIGILLSITLASFFAVLGGLIASSLAIAVVLGFTLFISVFLSMGVAIFMPWFLSRVHQDPALASGPFSTAVRDILSLFIYFIVASAVFNFLA